MFGKLRDKLKGALKKFSKDVEEEGDVETVEERPEEEVVEKEEPEEKPAVKEAPEEEKPSEEVPEKEPEQEEQPSEEEPQKEEAAKDEEQPVEKEETPEKETGPSEPSLSPTSQKSSEEPEKEEEAPRKKGFFGKVFGKKESVEEPVETVEEDSETPQEAPEPTAEDAPQEQAVVEEAPAKEAPEEEVKEKKSGFFSRITKVKLSEERFDDVFWDLEVALLENNVAMEVIEKVKGDLRKALAGEKVSRKGVQGLILDTLKESIKEALSVEQVDLLAEAEEHQPLVIAMIGVNGSGKTTTLAKLAKYFQDHGKSVVAAAADTFRAAAIQQLEEHTTRLGVKLIKHDYQADPAAVAFDAVKHAKAKGIDVVLIDSAGRLHSNDNLMNELKKPIRVNKPDINIFVGEAVTGNDCVEQAKLFDQAVGIDALILAKADVDEKGGAPLSASYVTKKPVIFLGTGQSYEDLTPFKPEEVLEKLGL